ncbi:hypothetical protein FHX74_000835 [Friedmanniella endophytica]|uniref:O-antigen ligase like membrane protein n=1 Tax=Microlunatus kandeliicorticis TaxID=1759536 RepID=A0A7W3IQ95_9ACTN|nr:hypothetical protein [Microlunatus kandeliicorticis]MBA8793241.1 hypothetical protein [Microlunatus kandeliicorticis]
MSPSEVMPRALAAVQSSRGRPGGTGQVTATLADEDRGPRRRDPVRWITTLFVLTFVIQRVATPGVSEVPIIVPVTMVWLVAALRQQVVRIDHRRLVLWLVAAAVTALLAIPQLLLDRAPYVSVTSWAFWMVLWLPMVVHLADRSAATYRRAQRAIGSAGLFLSGFSVLFIGVQLLGLGYRDFVAEYLPSSLQVQGFIITYPISYGSSLYKSNGWLALEPSFMSFMLGVSLICALLAGMHLVKVLWIALGLLATTAGSGIAVVAVFVVVLVLTGRAAVLRRYALPGAALVLVFGLTALGESVFSRVNEGTSSDSSTSLRAIEPYSYLWPRWISDPASVVFGAGAGASRQEVTGSAITGLLVPNVAKVFFDYGVVGGVLLVAVMVAVYLRSPDLAVSLALAASMFTLQAAAPALVLCSLLTVTLWAPVDRSVGRAWRMPRGPRWAGSGGPKRMVRR